MTNQLRWKRFVLRHGIFRLIALSTFSIGVFIVWNWQSQSETATRFIVNLPPITIIPTSEQIARLPNRCGFLTVQLKADNSLTLNSMKVGSLTEPEKLTAKLHEIFKERREAKVFDVRFSYREDLTDDERTFKKVIVAAPPTAKYADVVQVIDAVRSSGTNEIWLQIDGENYWWIFNQHFEAL